ncbi:MAG: hydroxyacylglutathione hydrolase [Bdellovibrionales bacterium]
MFRFPLAQDFELYAVPALKDNYCYLLFEKNSSQTLAIDPSEAKPVFEALKTLNRNLTHIVNTHHHWDHTGGNEALKKHFKCIVLGPEQEAQKIPALDKTLSEKAPFVFNRFHFDVLEVPGHTIGHIALFEKNQHLLFSGDVLFCYGCGRVFEGTHETMNHSLNKLKSLPQDTKIFCGHEYALQNVEFALQLEPKNILLQKHFHKIKELREKGQPSVPTSLKVELSTNPFLKFYEDDFKKGLGLSSGATALEVFTKIRLLKDVFKSGVTLPTKF